MDVIHILDMENECASKNGILLINCNIKNSTKRDHKAQESIQSLILGNE
jgi:hypothetical protein